VLVAEHPSLVNSLKVPRFLQISIEIFIFACMVGATTLLLRPLQEAMRERMIVLRDSLIQSVEDFLGRDISYSSMGPSMFGTLDVRNVVISGAGEPLISVARLRVSWSLLRLLRDEPGFIQAISIDKPSIHFDRERDADIVALFSNGSKQLSLSDLFDAGIRFKLRNGAATVSMSENRFLLDALNFDVSLRGGRLQFQGEWSARGSLATAGAPSATQTTDISFSMKNRVNGDSALDFSNAGASLSVASFSSTLGSFASSLTINAMFEDNVVKLTKINDRALFDISADYALDSGRLVGTFRCEDFIPARLVSLSGALEPFNRLLFINTSGLVFFENNAQDGLSYALSFSGVLPAGFRLSDLNPGHENSSPVLDVVLGGSSFAINGEGDRERIAFDSLSVNIPKTAFPKSPLTLEGRAGFEGSLVFKTLEAEGKVALSGFSLSGGERLAADFAMRFYNNEITLEDGAISFGQEQFSGMSASARFAEQGMSVTLLMEQQENAGTGIAIDGFLDYEPQRLEVNVTLDTVSPDELLNIAAPFVTPPEIPSLPVPLEQILLSGDVFLTTDFTRFVWNAPRCAIDLAETGRLFSGALAGSDRRVEVVNGGVNLFGQTIIASGAVDFVDKDDVSFSLSALLRDTPYSLEGTILDLNSISVQGSYGLSASLSMPSPGAYSGYITLDSAPVPLGEQYARVSISASGRYTGADSWSLDLERLELANVPTPVSEASSLSLAGRVDQSGVAIPAIFFDDGRGGLNGALDVSWNRDFSTISGNVHLDNTKERYDLDGSFINKRLALRFDGAEMQLARFMTQSWDAIVSGSAALQWTSDTALSPHTALASLANPLKLVTPEDRFTVDIDLSSLSATVSGADIRLSADASLNTDRLVIQNIQARYGTLVMNAPLIQARRDGRVEGTAVARLEDPGNAIDMACTLGIDFTPIASWLNLDEAINSFQGLLSVDTFTFDSFLMEEPFLVNFSREQGLIALRGGARDMIRLRLSDDGDFYAALASPSPVRGSLIGSLRNNRIEALVPDLYVDLSALWRLMPTLVTDIIGLPGGFVTANLEISGSIADPEFFGVAEGNSIRMTVPHFLTRDIRPVPITFMLDGNEMRFGPIPAGVGSGQGLVSGWFRFDRWVPNVFTLDIQVPAETPLPVGFTVNGVMADGYASGNLKLSMEDMIFTATGDLVAQDTDITINAEELAATQLDAPITNERIITNFTIRSGRKVLFMWPNRDFPILQAYADMGDTLKIMNDTITRHFSLAGDISLKSGEIFYFQRSFYLREGTLSFNENEVQFEPRITARAELRDQSNEGMVTISMIVDESPLQSFTARFASNPPLSQMEILSYLGQSFMGDSTQTESGSEFSQSRLIASTADLFAQTWVLRGVERWVRDHLFLDMFSFRTQFIQNLAASQIWGQSRSAVNGETPTRTGGDALGFGNYLDNTSVFLGKYLDSNTFIQGMVSLRYDENRTAAAQGMPTLGGYAVEADIGFELRSPWMDIRMNIVPTHFEHLFIDDVSVSLIWRRSFFGL
jgi:hypothetical protein